MGKNFQYLKNWWIVSNPNKTLLFLQWLTATIPAVLNVVSAIPAANAIASITVGDFYATSLWLIIVFALDLVKQTSWEFQYRCCAKQLGHIYPRIQEQFFLKIFNAEDQNFKYTSKEKMINTITSNITPLADFCDYLSYKISYFLQALMTIVIIFSTNILIGFLILTIAILVYFAINGLNSAIGKRSLKAQEVKDSLTETFADMVDGRVISSDLNISTNLHEKYFEKVDTLMTNYKKRIGLQSIRDNWVYLTYTFIILIATLYLVKLVENNVLTVTTYLVLTPYLTSAISKMKDFFGIFNDLQNANISALRVKTLLDMSEKDMIQFGNNSTDKIDGAITFSNISYSSDDKLDKSLNTIKLLNTQIKKHDIVLFQGQRNCGKRALFYMLRRAIKPDNGTITFDTINIYDFDVETYKHNISYVTNKPYFFNDTILENLKYVEQNKRKIFKVCKEIGIHDTIMTLPEKYETNIIKNPKALSDKDKFLLGLARALLTESEIFMIYEFPIGLSKAEQEIIKQTLLNLKKRRTVIIFSAENRVNDIINRHFYVKAGIVEEIPIQRQTKKES